MSSEPPEDVHEAVAEEWEALTRLAERDDDVGAIATRLLETGGVVGR